MSKIKNFILVALSVLSTVLILVLIIMGFVIASKEKEFSYSKIKNMTRAENRITKRFKYIRSLPEKDQLKEIKKEKLPSSAGFFKRDYPIIIYRIDYDKADLLYLYEYIEKEHRQIINFSSFIIDK